LRLRESALNQLRGWFTLHPLEGGVLLRRRRALGEPRERATG
jgi:hypothetical protein